MESILTKWVTNSISVVLFAVLVGFIAWSGAIGLSIAGDAQSDVVTYYSEAGLGMMIESSNVDDLDAANIYKVIEVNRNVITSYRIVNKDGSLIQNTLDLLSHPTNRYKVVIRGDAAVGFTFDATQVA